jgi:hypothetical protein
MVARELQRALARLKAVLTDAAVIPRFPVGGNFHRRKRVHNLL